MLGWSLNLFRIRGILLAIHFSFFLLLALNAYSGWSDAGLPGMLWDTAVLVAFFICVVLHELGHCFTAMHFGIGVRRILLMPIGGMAEFDDIPRQPGRELLITLAGPAVNFAIAAGLWAALPAPVGDGESTVMTGLDFGHLLMQWNLAMGLFNLLPAFPMDGGRILRALLATKKTYLRATFLAATVGKVLCAIGMLIGAFYQPMLILLFGFIFFAGEMEYRAARRREIEDAHWRAVLARHHIIDLPVEEPPFLERR
jgi:Zn-dependent protease